MEVKTESNGAPSGRDDLRPTHDQLYLASRINDSAPKGRISIPALQKLNRRYGVAEVTGAMRSLRGFPPDELRTAYGYLEAICRGRV